jgi:hypothetical protein
MLEQARRRLGDDADELFPEEFRLLSTGVSFLFFVLLAE